MTLLIRGKRAGKQERAAAGNLWARLEIRIKIVYD